MNDFINVLRNDGSSVEVQTNVEELIQQTFTYLDEIKGEHVESVDVSELTTIVQELVNQIAKHIYSMNGSTDGKEQFEKLRKQERTLMKMRSIMIGHNQDKITRWYIIIKDYKNIFNYS